uniref:NADH dehydrogenase [ubiquinone] 1 beta subcomplex subunit 2, mitochondrial n=1 Tax=Mola mola TaxID=94237 RepID=A0A3Q3VKI4_MOLML
MSSFGRALGVLRAGSRLVTRGPQRIASRKAGGGPHIEPQYRQYPQITKKQKFESELISGAMWFWILWHCWHDPDAVLVSKHAWTDEELGIPPDDEE